MFWSQDTNPNVQIPVETLFCYLFCFTVCFTAIMFIFNMHHRNSFCGPEDKCILNTYSITIKSLEGRTQFMQIHIQAWVCMMAALITKHRACGCVCLHLSFGFTFHLLLVFVETQSAAVGPAAFLMNHFCI